MLRRAPHPEAPAWDQPASGLSSQVLQGVAPAADATRLPHLPGLDGVRALAVVAVLLFHLPARLLPGGFLGVDVFFVLSGFLITSLLLGELDRTGRIGFRQFYLRRARRLLPALLAVLGVTTLLVLTVARDAAAVFRQDALAALTYTTNWWYVIDDRSYFEVMGRPPLLQHLWSLGIEEQFYLVWPAVCLFAWLRWGRRGVAWAAAGGAVAGTVWMAVLANAWDVPQSADAARLYFGADTHAMTVLLGAALATVWRPGRLPRQIPGSAQAAVTVAGGTAIAALLAIFLLAGEDAGWLYRGGFLLVAVVSGVLVAAAAHPAGRFGVALGSPVLGWLGTRSYGIYLWHWPVFLVTRPDLDLPYGGWAAALTSLGLTFLAAEASYRWIEMPVRRGAVARLWQKVRQGGARERLRVAGVAALATATVAVGASAVAAVPEIDSTDYLDGATAVGAGSLEPKGGTGSPSRQTGDGAGPGWSSASTSGEPGDDREEKGDGARPGQPLDRMRTTIVGDSVILGARVAVMDAVPRVTIDAAISRQPYDIVDRVRERIRADALGPLVVIQTGTNGIPAAGELRDLLIDLRDRERVVLLNVRSPVPWMEQSNRAIDIAARGLDHVVVADWASASAGHGEYFYADGTHLTDRGRSAYARLILQSLQ